MIPTHYLFGPPRTPAVSTCSASAISAPCQVGSFRKLGDNGSNPAPNGRPVVVAGGHELVSTGDAFPERLVAVAFEHQLRRAPNVDIRDHALKLHIFGQ